MDQCHGQCEITERINIASFQRFASNHTLYTTSDYSANTKRNNAAVLIDGKYFFIEKCITGKLFCTCTNACKCVVESYVICTELLKQRQQTFKDSYVSTDLSDIWENVIVGGKMAFHVSRIRKKAIVLETNKKLFVFGLPKFEID